MQTLYPSIKTYAEHRLNVDPLHMIYFEEAGNPDGLPVLVVHSGPGSGCENYHRCFFDPGIYRIILFDQRGAGRSTPHTELKNNTTADLISDMEAIRKHLNIDRWVLWGGAWGSTLSLIYAQTYPEHTIGLVLHSIFLGREKDIDWFYKKGANLIFPDYWADFIQGFPIKEQANPLQAYYKKLNGQDELARMSTAKAWSLWQARCAALQPHHQIIDHFSDPHLAIGLATIECHYFINNCFITENQILNNMDKIKHIPGYIIHGRYNIVCPLQNAWTLHQAWDASELYIIRDAGHSVKEPGVIDANIIATNNMAKTHFKTA